MRLIDSCITQRKAQGPFRTCDENKDEEEDLRPAHLVVELAEVLILANEVPEGVREVECREGSSFVVWLLLLNWGVSARGGQGAQRVWRGEPPPKGPACFAGGRDVERLIVVYLSILVDI